MSNGPVFFLSDSTGKRTPIRIERGFSVADASGTAPLFTAEYEFAGYTGSVSGDGLFVTDDQNIQTQREIAMAPIDVNGVNRSGVLLAVEYGDVLKVSSKTSPQNYFYGVVEVTESFVGSVHFTFSEILEAQGPVYTGGDGWLALGERVLVERHIFDPMLKNYLGGYTAGHVPRTTLFNLRGIPPGTYDLYLYSGQKDQNNGTDFYVQINGNSPVLKTVTPQFGTHFIENNNYARFNLVLSSVNDVVHVTAVGFLNGMQLKRV